MNAGLVVRRAVAEDIDGVLRVERGASEAPHWDEARYRAMLQEARRVLLVAVAEGRVVGFAVTAVVLEEAELESIAVDAALRRGGVGKVLMSAVIGWARGRGAELMRLEVRVGNEAARGLYRGFGFVECGLRRGYYSEPVEDAVVLSVAWGR